MDDAISETAAATISKVSVKLPQFWKDSPELWFITAESNFDLAGIVQDSTKYNHVISKLDPEVLREVRDIVSAPPDRNKYSTVKNALISRLCETETHKLRRLLTDIQLGDRKPSQLLRDMRELAKNNITDDALKSLWLQRLPSQVQVILSISKDGLSDLANMADSIIETLQPTSASVYAVQAARQPSTEKSSDIVALQQEVKELKQLVEKLAVSQITFNSRSRSRSRSSRFGSSRSRSNSSQKNGICWYHNQYGAKAQKCSPPCTYAKGNEENHH